MRHELIEVLMMAEDEDLQISVSDDIIRDEQVIEVRVSNCLLKDRVSAGTGFDYLMKEERTNKSGRSK